MATRDQTADLHVVTAAAPQVISDGSSIVTEAIDTAGYESVTFVITLGTIADDDATWDVVLKSGDTDTQGQHTAVDEASILGGLAKAGFDFEDDGATRKIGYVGNDRYVSLEVDNDVANTGNLPIAITCVLGNPHTRPTSNPPA